MRSFIHRDYDPTETIGVNPHRRCVCANWNNEDGSCSYCEWEEEHTAETDETTPQEENEEEIPNEKFVRELIGDEAFDFIRNNKKTVKEMNND